MKRFWTLICLVLSIFLTACTATPDTPTVAPETTSPYPKPDKLIALTFDDGPNNDAMAMVLDVLEKYDVPATFFVIGNRITDDTAPVIKRAFDMGCEIGNHGYTHTRMNTMDEKTLLNEIEQTQAAVEAITGQRPALFRPPYLSAGKRMGYFINNLPFIAGVSIGDGTSGSTRQERYEATMNGAYDGCIMLMHCYSSCTETALALEDIIPDLMMQGYELVTVSELFARVGVTPETGTGKLIENNQATN